MTVNDEPGVPTLPADARAGGLELLVVEGASMRVVPLPARGTVRIGRSPRCEIEVRSGSVSRQHAALVIGDSVDLEDLGSANGTRVGDRVLAANERARLAEGTGFRVGDATLVLRACTATPGVAIATATFGALEHAIGRVAASELPILVTGETGVGKSLLAERVHQLSRRVGPFVRIDCRIDARMLELDLFGPADTSRAGKLEAAAGGTVLLDNVDALPAELQPRLVQAIDASTVRFVAATAVALEARVEEGVFARELYYRLGGATFVIPPLRERRDEIVPLAQHFLATAARALGRTATLDADTASWLTEQEWPGNARELRNTCERAVLLADGHPIARAHVDVGNAPAPRRRDRRPTEVPVAPVEPERRMSAELRAKVGELERQRIIEAIEKCGGNQTRAAELLGISARTLSKRLDEYGIARPRKSARPS